MADKKNYTIEKTVDTDEIPSWTRREPKWLDLINAVLALEPGKALEVSFPTKEEAETARNHIRDEANHKLSVDKEPLQVRTRLVEKPTKTVIYLALHEISSK